MFNDFDEINMDHFDDPSEPAAVPDADNERFCAELRALLDRYHAKLVRVTNYNNHDDPCGRDFYVEGPSLRLDLYDVAVERGAEDDA